MDATTTPRRCHARSKRSGERCRRLAIPGGTVCVMHGGAAPQVARAARGRLSDAAAREVLARMAPEALARVRGADPHPADVTHALERLCRARQRQPRWWAAVDERIAQVAMRVWAEACAREVERLLAEEK